MWISDWLLHVCTPLHGKPMWPRFSRDKEMDYYFTVDWKWLGSLSNDLTLTSLSRHKSKMLQRQELFAWYWILNSNFLVSNCRVSNDGSNNNNNINNPFSIFVFVLFWWEIWRIKCLWGMILVPNDTFSGNKRILKSYFKCNLYPDM